MCSREARHSRANLTLSTVHAWTTDVYICLKTLVIIVIISRYRHSYNFCLLIVSYCRHNKVGCRSNIGTVYNSANLVSANCYYSQYKNRSNLFSIPSKKTFGKKHQKKIQTNKLVDLRYVKNLSYKRKYICMYIHIFIYICTYVLCA